VVDLSKENCQSIGLLLNTKSTDFKTIILDPAASTRQVFRNNKLLTLSFQELPHSLFIQLHSNLNSKCTFKIIPQVHGLVRKRKVYVSKAEILKQKRFRRKNLVEFLRQRFGEELQVSKRN
jgi:hypothetical protein